MWISLSELSGMEQLINCADGMWIAGGIGLILGALIGSGIYYMLWNWD